MVMEKLRRKKHGKHGNMKKKKEMADWANEDIE